MNAAVTQSSRSFQQDLRYYLPRWMAVFAAITLIQEVMLFPSTGRGVWTIPSLIVISLVEGAFGGLVFVCLQRWWNPKDSRVVRIRNYGGIIVAVGSLWVNFAISS